MKLNQFTKKGILNYIIWSEKRNTPEERDSQDTLAMLKTIYLNIDMLSTYKGTRRGLDYRLSVRGDRFVILSDGYESIGSSKVYNEAYDMEKEEAEKEISELIEEVSKKHEVLQKKVEEKIAKTEKPNKEKMVANTNNDQKRSIVEFAKENGVKVTMRNNLNYSILPEVKDIEGFNEFLEENGMIFKSGYYYDFVEVI